MPTVSNVIIQTLFNPSLKRAACLTVWGRNRVPSLYWCFLVRWCDCSCWFHKYLAIYSFICLVASTRRSSSWAATCYYQSYYSMVEAIPSSTLTKNTTSKHAGLSFHYVLILNVKLRSCEYLLLKSFGLTRRENEPKSTDYEADH